MYGCHVTNTHTHHTHIHTHTTHTRIHTPISEPHHHWVEQNMLSAILPSSRVSGIQNGTGEIPICTSVVSSVQLEICDGYQMRTTVGSQRLTLMSLDLAALRWQLLIHRLHTYVYLYGLESPLSSQVSCTVQYKIASHVVVLFSVPVLVHADHVGGCGCVGHRGNTEAVEV